MHYIKKREANAFSLIEWIINDLKYIEIEKNCSWHFISFANEFRLVRKARRDARCAVRGASVLITPTHKCS